MTDMLSFFLSVLGDLFTWLGTCQIVQGVTLLSFFGSMILITVLIRSLLLRAR